MLLLIDADKNSDTGWYGYDFIINKNVKNDTQTSLMRYDEARTDWIKVANVVFRYQGNKLMISVPRKVLGLGGNSFAFDFKWSDNTADLNDPISLCLNGDTAPNRRFNYRCIWNR